MLLGAAKPAKEESKPGAYVLDHKVKSIAGKNVNLAQYNGKVLLLVNVASKCGFTPQYEQLQAVFAQYKAKGFMVLGFPANNFGRQEPGSNESIQQFCRTRFNAQFDMFAKISVKGDDIHPLYKELTSKKHNAPFAGDIQWNFTKFLINRDGKVVARFAPKTKPDAPEVLKAIERELAVPPPKAPKRSNSSPKK